MRGPSLSSMVLFLDVIAVRRALETRAYGLGESAGDGRAPWLEHHRASQKLWCDYTID
jgi:hypothetical protein